jgi:hypothetical protein
MRDDQHRFLSVLGRLPARLTAEQVAWVINCQPHDIPVLVAARLLKPLGNAPANTVKYFATAELIELMEDRAWLAKLTNAVTQHWWKMNQRKRAGSLVESQGGPCSELRDLAPLGVRFKNHPFLYYTCRAVSWLLLPLAYVGALIAPTGVLY